ncbi:MAG: hypothetical protein GPJ51_03620 [Candidatus Heimdallarchaeota archaeon]|nr:hypothetical protein [Candidatus Heimdallarchaeota archaeon]
MNNLGSFEYQYSVFSTSQPFNSKTVIELIKKQKKDNVHLQILDPTFIVSEKQIIAALYHTKKAFQRENNIARDFTTEFLLRLSGKRQISNAINFLGIKDSCINIMIIAFGEKKEEIEYEFDIILETISKNINLQTKKKFPIASLEKLALHYKCEENLEIIEKKAFETMAFVEIL